MATKLIIDGYNLIKSTHLADKNIMSDLEFLRKSLIEKLSIYKKLRHLPITVIFDGEEGGYLQESRENIRGIQVIFSRQGEKADNVIEKITRNQGEGFIVVTSDRLLAEDVRRNGSAIISSPDFADKLEMAKYLEIKGLDQEDNYHGSSRLETKKKGNPRRAGKKHRKEQKRLAKL